MTDTITDLNARLDGIGHVVRDRRLRVPEFQRSYAWELEQVDTYWADLRAAIDLPSPSYFLGTVVLSSEKMGASTIIDGQQRLATTALLLCAIRDEFAQVRDPRAAAVQNQYLSFFDMQDGDQQPRLQLNTEDDGFYRVLALQGQPGTPDSSSTKRLLAAYGYLREAIQREVAAARDHWSARLFKWTEFLERDVHIITVDVPTAADAFMIFETLNDRGMPLTVADLLKNYLFGVAADDLASVRTAWSQMRSDLDCLENEQRLLDYLRQYWSSVHGATRERDLYRRIRSQVRSPRAAVELTLSLNKSASDYYALVTGDAPLWPPGVNEDEVFTLRALGLSQNRPMLLAAMAHFTPDELGKLVRATISWSIRGIVAGQIGGGTTERHYCDAAVRIRAGRINTTAGVLETLGSIVPTDEDFSTAATTMAAPKASISRILLVAWEQHLSNVQPAAVLSEDEYGRTKIQRVLPRAPNDSWTEFTDEDALSWSRRFGNAALAPRGGARISAGRTWSEVRAELAQSPFETSKEAALFADWSPDTITARQKAFAADACKIWPRS